MPLDAYPFSPRYGWIEDKYGVSWQLVFEEDHNGQQIVPSLLFVGEQLGNAEAAISFYTSAFPNSEVGEIARYGPDHPEQEGTVMFADCWLDGYRIAVLDSAEAHEFFFSEAISFIIHCDGQDEVDHYWESFCADGGEEGQCGWVTDKFGVSWQVTPTVLSELLSDNHAEKSERVMAAMLEMKKLEISPLEAAYEGD